MSTTILLLAIAIILHVIPPILPRSAAAAAIQYMWAPIGLSALAVLLAIAADSLRAKKS